MTEVNVLNESQKQVLLHKNGPLLVIAGPGSGKTKTLVERVVLLIQDGIAPESIFIATFTEKASKELITRISNRLLELGIKANLNEMYIGTLHSIFLRFLEEYKEFTRLKRNHRLLDQFEQSFFIYRNLNVFLGIEHIHELIGEPKINRWRKAELLVEKINVVCEEVLDVKVMKHSEHLSVRALAECYELYQNILEEENALDFSSIQSEMLKLLENNPQVLEEIQNKVKYFMIDEYQDTNTVQEKIVLLLASKNNNICVVGDDDQGLYRFRGATVRNILEFADNFGNSECQKVYLSTNYRSHPSIIDFYNKWMDVQDWTYNDKTFRFDKTITPCDRNFSSTTSVVKVSSSDSIETYYEEVLVFINELKEKKVINDYNQIAFLFRSVKGDAVIGLANYLEKNGIRVFSPRSELFFDRDEVKMTLGALVTIFPTLFDNLYEGNNISTLYEDWKEFFQTKVTENIESNRQLIKWIIDKQRTHTSLLKSTNYAFTALIYQMLQFPIFAKYLDVELNVNKNDLRPAYNIGMITSLLNRFEYLYNVTVLTVKNIDKTLSNLFNDYLRFIVEGGLSEYESFDETTPFGCVSFMTIHQSKGLEFPITIVGSMSGIPRKDYNEIDKILQEEYHHKPMYEPLEKVKYYDFYRLYYTAFSRAQNLLVLTGYEHKSKGGGSVPSKYLRDIWEQVPSWRDNSVFDLSNLKLAEVKPVNIKHEYSFTSHILLYESCPLQYKFYKELEFVEVRTGGVIGGSLLHQTIEDIHRAVLRDEVDTLTDVNISKWFNMNYELLVKQQRSFLREEQQAAILKQVLRYRDNNSDKWHLIREAEVDVSLVKDDYILKGAIDLIKGEDGTVELIDFKSGDKPDVNTRDEKKRAQINQYRRQLEVYAHLVEQRTGAKVSNMHIYYPKEENANPRITFPYREYNVSATIDSFEQIVRKIESRDFSMDGVSRSEKHCGDCDMRFYCINK